MLVRFQYLLNILVQEGGDYSLLISFVSMFTTVHYKWRRPS